MFASALGCLAEDSGCLRNTSAQDVVNAQGDTFWIPWPIDFKNDLPWQPVIDGVQVIDQPLNLIISGNFAHVPVILGTVRNETTSFLYGSVTEEIGTWEYEAILFSLFGLDMDTVFDLYPCKQLHGS